MNERYLEHIRIAPKPVGDPNAVFSFTKPRLARLLGVKNVVDGWPVSNVRKQNKLSIGQSK